MKWLKYRYRYSSGPGPWIYEIVPENYTTEDAKEYITDRNEDFRGFDYYIVDTIEIPKDVIIRNVSYLRRQQKAIESTLNWLEKEICYE